MTYSVRDYWLPFPEYERSSARDKSAASAASGERSRSRTEKQSDEAAAPLSRWAGAFGAVVGAAFRKKRE